MTSPIQWAREVLAKAPGLHYSHGAGSYKVSAAEAAGIALARNTVEALLAVLEGYISFLNSEGQTVCGECGMPVTEPHANDCLTGIALAVLEAERARQQEVT